MKKQKIPRVTLRPSTAQQAEIDKREFVKSLVGKDEETAENLVKSKGFKCRVWYKGSIGTMDYRTDRINIHVDNGIVTRSSIG